MTLLDFQDMSVGRALVIVGERVSVDDGFSRLYRVPCVFLEVAGERVLIETRYENRGKGQLKRLIFPAQLRRAEDVAIPVRNSSERGQLYP
jgi:hypothetical protein